MIFDASIDETIKKIRDKTNPLHWCVIGYAGKKELKVQASGEGDVEEFKAQLKPDEAQYV